MGITFSWGFDPSKQIDEFRVEKSSDKGATWGALRTVPFNLTGADYSSKSKRFSVTDPDGSSSSIYRITSVGEAGVSYPVFFIPPDTSKRSCTIYGTILTLDGQGSPKTVVYAQPTGRGSRLVTMERVLAYPDLEGVWQMKLVAGVVVRVSIPGLDFAKTIEVPDVDGPVSIDDIPEVSGFSSGSENGQEFAELA